MTLHDSPTQTALFDVADSESEEDAARVADTGSVYISHATDDSEKTPARVRVIQGDARSISASDETVDLVVTSPPYWQKRDYGMPDQIGQESDVIDYIEALVEALREWRRLLRPTGSVFLNIGDTYFNRSLAGVPALLESAAREDGWLIRNRIIWAKEGGMPDPARTRLVNRHEYILHLTPGNDYYYDLFAYANAYGNGSNPGDVWTAKTKLSRSEHLAPFPDEIVERAITLACPRQVCTHCGAPRTRQVERTAQLDPARPQAARAMELARQHKLTPAHIAAIQATGISDAGKARKTQNGTDRNSEQVKELAAYAKKVLGGYFREFTFAQRVTAGWSNCGCAAPWMSGVVLDPFMGTGTVLRVAQAMNRSAIGVDLLPLYEGKSADSASSIGSTAKYPVNSRINGVATKQNNRGAKTRKKTARVVLVGRA